MQNHKETKFWFTSIIGFFYQYGIGCDIEKNKALELYLLAVGNEKSLNQKFTNVYLLEKDDNEFDTMKNINIIVGKYLLSFFYYKDIILDKLKLSKYLESLGFCYQFGQGVTKNHNKAFELYFKSANNGCAL